MTEDAWPDDVKALFALALVETCFRNTSLEDLHAGLAPESARGDFEDVKVVWPGGEIAWNRLSRISDEEMKALMIEAVNKVYTFISAPEELLVLGGAARWNRPQLDPSMHRVAQRRAAIRQGLSQEEAWKAFPLYTADPSSVMSAPEMEASAEIAAYTPDQLRDLALSASPDIGWIRKAREALLAAADDLESRELELLDAYEIAEFGA